MAELSEQTKAIIERLKAEGQLVRNTGTNSIRSVKVQLDRFEGIFSTISANVVEQTSLMQKQLGMAEKAVEAQKTKEQFEELDPPEVAPQTESRSSDDTNKKIDEIGDKIAGALTFRNIAMAAGGLFVGYNILKGFVDEKTDGGFTEMENTIKNTNWTDLKNTINEISTEFGKLDVGNLVTAMNNAATKINQFNTWLDETGIGDIASAVVAGGLVAAGTRGAVGGIFDGLKGAGKGNTAARLSKIPGGIAMATAGLGIYYGEDIANWIVESTNLPGNDTASLLTTTIQGASLMMLFGPKAAIATAIVGAAITLGSALRDWVLENKQTELDQMESDLEQIRRDLENARNENRGLTQEEKDRAARVLAEARRNRQLLLNAELEEQNAQVLAEAERLRGLETVTTNINSLQAARLYEQVMNGVPGAEQELLNYAIYRESDRGRISRALGGTKDEWIAEFLQDFDEFALGPRQFENADGTFVTAQQREMREAIWNEIVSNILNPSNIDRPTEGLDSFQEYLRRQEAAGWDNPAAVVISPTTIAPVTVNAPKGGDSVQKQNVMVVGGASADPANPYNF